MIKTGTASPRSLPFFAIVLLLFVSACAQQTLTVNDVSGPAVWGTASNVMQIKHLHIAGQPDEAGLRQAKAEGIATVINLRAANELNWDEKAYVESIGMNYISIPVSGKLDGLDRAAFVKVEKAIKAQNGTPTLLHCSSGNRASAWLANHLYDTHGLSRSKALAIARKTGLTKQELEQRLNSFWISAE